jgi:hypothetical protein
VIFIHTHRFSPFHVSGLIRHNNPKSNNTRVPLPPVIRNQRAESWVISFHVL